MYDNLPLNLARVTEAAAVLASKHLGRGDKKAASIAAVNGMRAIFKELYMDGMIVVGERESEDKLTLKIGERVGHWDENSPKVDIAVDPVDGIELIANGENNALAVIACAPRGNMLKAPDIYMDKLAAGPLAAGSVNLDMSIDANIKNLAKTMGKEVEEVTVAVMNRSRHTELIKKIRESGARIKLVNAGDIAAAIATCFPDSGIDMMLGIGGAPEGVIAAAAIKAMGGVFMGRFAPDSDAQIQLCLDMGIEDIDKIWEIDDMVKGNDCMFAATGITDGYFLKGVVNLPGNRLKTHSVVMRSKTGTLRFLKAFHGYNNKDNIKVVSDTTTGSWL